MTEPHYPTCDHPRLLVQDGVCYLCDQFDGQTDALDQTNELYYHDSKKRLLLILPTMFKTFLPQHQEHHNQNRSQNQGISANSNNPSPKSNAADGAAAGPHNNMFAKHGEP